MEELIFFAIIIVFTILESIARSRKGKRSGGAEPMPLPEGTEWERKRESSRADDGLSTYDEDPSFDSRPSYDDAATGSSAPERYTAPADRTGHPGARRSSSETMLPGELLEQLESLANQRGSEQRRARPRQPAKPRSPAPIAKKTTRVTVASTRRQEHPIHRSHAGFGTDPSERAPSEQDALGSVVRHVSVEAAAVRGMLRGSGASALRQAVVLREVLGPPLALRGEPEGSVGG